MASWDPRTGSGSRDSKLFACTNRKEFKQKNESVFKPLQLNDHLWATTFFEQELPKPERPSGHASLRASRCHRLAGVLPGSGLQTGNQNAAFCMRRCAARRTSRAEFIRENLSIAQTSATQSGNGAGCAKNRKWESNMLNKLLAAAAVAAIAYATCPANAAKVSAGCSGGNLTK